MLSLIVMNASRAEEIGFQHSAALEDRTEPQTKYRFDPELIEYEGSTPPDLRIPFVAKYTDGDRELFFIAAEHGVVANNPTIPFIDKMIQTEKPGAVILEGFWGTPSHNILQKTRECTQNKFVNCSEVIYSAAKALEAGIPFVGGDATQEDVLKKLKAQKFSDRDISAFFVLRQMTQWKDEGLFKKASLSKLIDDFFKSFDPKNVKALTEAEVRHWYREHYARELDPIALERNIVRPQKSPNAPILQRMAFEIDKAREPQILSTIGEKLEAHKKVLIIFGSGHQAKNSSAIQQLLPQTSYVQRP